MAGVFEAVIAGVSTVTVAVIAGSIAVRNARKTPHENLKSLLELLKDPDIRTEDRAVLDRAVHREISRIGLLNDARIQGFWAYQRARYLGGMSRYTQNALLAALVLPALTIPTAFLWPLQGYGRLPEFAPAPDTGTDDHTTIGYLRWRVNTDWDPHHLLQRYVLVTTSEPWAYLSAYAALSLAFVVAVRLAVSAARTGRLRRASAIFAVALLPSQLVTYMIFRISSRLSPEPVIWLYNVRTSCPPGSFGSRPIATSIGPRFECLEVGDQLDLP